MRARILTTTGTDLCLEGMERLCREKDRYRTSAITNGEKLILLPYGRVVDGVLEK